MKLRLLYSCTLVCIIACGSIDGYAQNCTVCTIDLTCDSVPANPKLCPSTLPTDTAQQYYEADVTFYMPQQFDITDPISATVDLLHIQVVGLSGLPAGMQWTSYDYTGTETLDFYPPANPPSSERGCAKICGTPLLPGNYVITVSVLAYVYVASQNVTQAQSFEVLLTIVPNPSGNSVFTMSANQGCDTVSADFAPILQSGGDPLFTYNWDFGDSTTSTDEFPTHNYTNPGTYVVTCQMDILEYVLSDVSVSVTNDDWCGELFDELTCGIFGEAPDIYFRLNDGSSLYDSPSDDNTLIPSWTNLGVVINGNQFTIQFFDSDGFTNPDDDLGSTIINVTGAGSYPVSTISPNLGTQAIAGNLTIITQIDTSYIDYDTIYVFAQPTADTISFSLNDSICSGDSVVLTTGGGAFYKWYEDTTLIVGAVDSSYVTYQTGDYWATVISSQGCEANTDMQSVTVIPYPSSLTFFNNANELTTFSSEPNLQWYMDGVAIPGATGTIYTITQDGNYFLTATNILGCVTSSDTLFVTYTPPLGVNELPVMRSLKVYPNPNTGSFTVKFGTFENKDIVISVRDVIGRTVFTRNYGKVNGTFASEVELGSVTSGVYTVTIEIGNYSFYRKVLVK